MTNVSLSGPFELTRTEIDLIVSSTSPGVYALGPPTGTGTMYVHRVGRSDADLNARLKQYIGQYTHFCYAYRSTAKEAYYAECSLYHQFNPKDNVIHPDSPTGQYLTCPRVGCAA